jgi:hypothetical protein
VFLLDSGWNQGDDLGSVRDVRSMTMRQPELDPASERWIDKNGTAVPRQSQSVVIRQLILEYGVD